MGGRVCRVWGGNCRWCVLQGLGVSASGYKRCLIRRWASKSQGNRERGGGRERGREREREREREWTDYRRARLLTPSLPPSLKRSCSKGACTSPCVSPCLSLCVCLSPSRDNSRLLRDISLCFQNSICPLYRASPLRTSCLAPHSNQHRGGGERRRYRERAGGRERVCVCVCV